ncbi:DUF2892 domain-containing protein [Flavobacteriaceae bacterium Ap0902]|nr:DUF2892 domain-containing protein [Flavobacteriaceae bacterium Ap0902]
MNKYIKLIIAAILLFGGIYMFYEREYGWGVMLILLMIIPILLFFRNEYILLAFWEMRKQNLEKSRKWLNKITNPQNQLIAKQMGYYNYMMGLTESQSNIAKSESYMRKALDHGLSFAHDRAMAKMNLAAGAMSRGRKQEAQKWVKEAKADDKQGIMTEQIKMFEDNLKRMNVGRNMQNPQTRRGKYF